MLNKPIFQTFYVQQTYFLRSTITFYTSNKLILYFQLTHSTLSTNTLNIYHTKFPQIFSVKRVNPTLFAGALVTNPLLYDRWSPVHCVRLHKCMEIVKNLTVNSELVNNSWMSVAFSSVYCIFTPVMGEMPRRAPQKPG